MKPLILVGGGGHCHSCIDVIEAAGIYQIAGVVQPEISSDLVLGYPIVGNDNDLPRLLENSESALVTVGQVKNPAIRIRLFNFLKELGAELAVVVSPNAHFSRHSVMGEGSIVMHGAIVNANVQIGRNCIVNSQALVEHDVVINDHCHISTGALINGNVTIGRGSFVGSGAVIKEGVKVGENAVIGAGQDVLQDVPNFAMMKNVSKKVER